MLLPSMSIVVLAVAIIGSLMAVNWYVWGKTWASDFRAASHVIPFSSRELIEQALGQLVATNQAVLPQIVLAPSNSRHTQRASSVEHTDDGFKHVA